MAASVIVTGPKACGKTRSAEALRRHFGLVDVVDDWDGRSAVPMAGTLILTNCPAPACAIPSLRLVEFDQAVAEINRPSRNMAQRDAFA
jgi:hypothetical protein